ncbi:MAG: hypothetical protein IPK59_13970 [Rhodospirillaceae bacterium]|nr:hypothetical protein [Rhodospirillaceae bacterium]
MTGYINYLDRNPDPRLLHLQEIWEQLVKDGKLPAYSAAGLVKFPVAPDHASIIEVRHDGKRRRYFVVKDGAAVVEAVGIDCSGTYLDAPSDTPEYHTILISDYDGVVASRRPRLYAEEHHLDNRARLIAGIQLPFAADGEHIDVIVEFVYALEELA